MKKTLIAFTVMALPAFTSMAYAADGSINFTGAVTDAACEVNTASKSQAINLGTVSSKAFTAMGSTAAATKFNITLSDCPTTVKSASIKFDGLINTQNADLLAISKDSTATGLGVAIYEADSATQIPMLQDSAAKVIDSSAATNVLSYVAKYMSTASTVSAGTANAVTDFTIMYN